MADKFVFWNSSLPRSASTLFQNILIQNPTIYASATDPFLEYIFAARTNYTATPEVKAQDPALMLKAWRGFCYGSLMGYCNGLTDRPNVCLKTRGGTIHWSWFKAFYDAHQAPLKMICMVRDLRAIFASMEKLYQKAQEQHQPIQNHAQMTGTTLQKRMDIWSASPPVGLALERLQETLRTGVSKHLLFVRAEDLTSRPGTEMARVYQYLGLPAYEHDFNNVVQVTKEDDAVYGLTQDLHTIRQKVEPLGKDYTDVLGKDICTWVNTRFDWYQKHFHYA